MVDNVNLAHLSRCRSTRQLMALALKQPLPRLDLRLPTP